MPAGKSRSPQKGSFFRTQKKHQKEDDRLIKDEEDSEEEEVHGSSCAVHFRRKRGKCFVHSKEAAATEFECIQPLSLYYML